MIVVSNSSPLLAIARISQHDLLGKGPTNQLHHQALALADELEASGTRLVTTWAVLLEIGNALSKVQYRHAAVQLLFSLQSDANMEIVPQAGPLLEEAMKLSSERPDKE